MKYRQHLHQVAFVCSTLTSLYAPDSFSAPVVQATVGAESSRFVDGVDITDGKPTINLAVDVSFNNGSFAGADCYKAQTLLFQDGIDAGCNYYIGYFQPLKKNQAFSAVLSRSEYAPTPARQWDYTAAALSWHASRSAILTVTATDDWFGRGYSSVGIGAAYQYSLSDHWSATFEASHIDFASNAPVNNINHARLGLLFEKGRWATELNLQLNDGDRDQLISIDPDQQAALSFRVNYRFY